MHRAPRKEVLERKNLAAITQRALRQKAQLGQAVDDDAVRVQRFHLVENEPDRLAELHLGGMKNGQLLARIQRRFRRNKLEDGDAVERPAMPLGN